MTRKKRSLAVVLIGCHFQDNRSALSRLAGHSQITAHQRRPLFHPGQAKMPGCLSLLWIETDAIIGDDQRHASLP